MQIVDEYSPQRRPFLGAGLAPPANKAPVATALVPLVTPSLRVAATRSLVLAHPPCRTTTLMNGGAMLSSDVGVSLHPMMWVWVLGVSLFVVWGGFQSLAPAMKTKTHTRARYNITVTDDVEKRDTILLRTLVAGTCCGPKSKVAVGDVSGEGLASALSFSHCHS
jgi:hypothetical protein